MNDTIASPPVSAERWRAALLAALALLLAAALVMHGPIPQWDHYHAFADRRSLLGIPNAADVLSNLAFAGVGLWALSRLRGRREPAPARAAWRIFALALVATAAGSGLYHWSPDNAALVLDRLPIAWACAALLCAFLAERVDIRWARPAVLAAALLVATASVGFWWWSELRGAGDLRAYLFVQLLPMLLVPAGLLWRQRRPVEGATPAAAWWVVLAGYGLAKLLELGDGAVFASLGLVSGHTLKHLLAAAAAGWLLRAALSSGSPR